MSTKPAAAKQVFAPAKPKSDIGPSFFVLGDGPLEIAKTPVARPAGMILAERGWMTPVREGWEWLRALPDEYPRTIRMLSVVTGVCLVGTLLVMRSRMPEAWAPAQDDVPPAPASAAASVLPSVSGPGVGSAPNFWRQPAGDPGSSPLGGKYTGAKSADSKAADNDTMAALASLAASLQQDTKEQERLRARNRRLEALVKALRNRTPKPPAVQPTVQQSER